MPDWPADKPERRPITSLKPFPRNARTHTPEQIAQVAASITKFGWTNSVLIAPDGEIIAGHARVLAALQLGIEQIPCIVATNWTDEEKRLFVIADNKLGLNAGWDEALLAQELADIQALGEDPTLSGFNDKEIEQLLAPPNDVEREWQGMPEFVQPADAPYQSITVHFTDAGAVADFCNKLGKTVVRVTKYIWYPEQKQVPQAHLRYAADDKEEVA